MAKSKRKIPVHLVAYPGLTKQQSLFMNSGGKLGTPPPNLRNARPGPGKWPPGWTMEDWKQHEKNLPKGGKKPPASTLPGGRPPKGKGVTVSASRAALSRAQAAKQFQERLTAPSRVPAGLQDAQNPSVQEMKRKFVKGLKQYEFGGTAKGTAGKAFYGGDYKAGTVARLNKKIQGGKKLSKSAGEQIKALTEQATASTDATQKAALQKHADELTAAQAKQGKTLKQSEADRQKFLDKRNKMLKSVYVNMKTNPTAVERARKKKVQGRYQQLTK